MEKISGNIYETTADKKEVIEGEAERLRNADFPGFVSRELIGEITPEMRVLDIGSGENSNLAALTSEKGGQYVALDRRLDALQTLVSSPDWKGTAIQANATELPLRDRSVDISHSRLVHAWLNDEQRVAAVQEMFRVLREGGKFVAIDFDWETMEGSPAIMRFAEVATTILGRVGFDSTYGSHALQTVSEASPRLTSLTEQRFHREAGMFYNEIFDKEGPLFFMANRIQSPELAEEVTHVFKLLRVEEQAGQLQPFVPPDLVGVTGSKS